MKDLGLFVQDNYRITPKLTLYAGLRYEHTFMPTPPLTNPDYPQTGRIPGYNLNFAPRIGLAWSPDERTVIRAGYGIFYARYPGAMLNSLFTTNNM